MKSYTRITPALKEQMLTLRNEEGMSNAEIAEIYNISVLTVFKHIGTQPKVMSEMNIAFAGKMRKERRAVRAAIVAKIHFEELERQERERIRQARINAAREVVERQRELERKRQEALTALANLEDMLAKNADDSAQAEEVLAELDKTNNG